MIDKKIKYAVQGGGPNYLGKQKMVKAPKKWKSSPDHPDTELAYITEPEKQVLIALNLHGGLEDGKPNRGPSGIISLQGDMGGYGGTGGGGGSSGGGGGGNGGGNPNQDRAREEAIRAANKAAQDRAAASLAAQRAAQQAEDRRVNQLSEARKLMTQKTGIQMPYARTPIEIGKIDPYQQSHVLPNEIITDPWSTYDLQKKKKEIDEDRRVNQLSEARKLMTQPTDYLPEGIRSPLPYKDLDPYQINILNKAPGYEKRTSLLPTEKPKIDVGFQEAFRKQQIATDLRQKQQDPNYGQFFRPQPVVEKPKFFDTGLGKVVKNVGLGIIAPQLLAATPLAKPYSMYRTAKTLSNVANTLGWRKPKEVMTTLTSNLTPGSNLTKKTSRSKAEPSSSGRDGREDGIMQAQASENIIEENIQKFSPEQLNLLRERYAELQEVIESGEYNGQKLNNNQLNRLADISKQMEAFLVDPQKMMAAKGGLAGLHG